MSLTQREYDEEELRVAERRLSELSRGDLAVPATEEGSEYREKLAADVERIRARLEGTYDDEYDEEETE